MNAYELAMLIFAHPLVRAVAGLIAANVLVGIAAGFYTRTFYLAGVGDFLLTRCVPYLLGAGAFQLVLLTVPPEWSGIGEVASTAVWLFVVAALLGKILATLREIGLPVPAVLGAKADEKVTVRDEPASAAAG